MKNIKFFKYANKYVKCLNVFYDTYKGSIDSCLLDEEYDLITDILDDLMYDNRVSWYIKFKNNKYREDIIYRTDKECWKTLSKLYRKMCRITFGFWRKQINKLAA